MSFTSTVFLVMFFPVCVLGSYFIREEYRNYFLCFTSLFFYFWCGVRFLLLILFLSFLDYGIGLLLDRAKSASGKKTVLIAGLAVNIGVLCYYKYLFDILAAVSPWIASMTQHEIRFMAAAPALPMGISFYTFSLLSYMLDVYWGICSAQKNYLNIWLYVAFFPKVIQGPIMRYADFESQLHGKTVDLASLNAGLERFIKGMVKKVMIADQLQGLVDYSFSNISGAGTIPAWISVIAYMLQLYYDFSGYSDMAIGLGRMMGFTIPENFDHPYMASSVAEYWRRWHITLGAWFRDYVYTPCIRSFTRKPWTKRLKQPFLVCDALALLVTWVLTGVWHGSGLRFLVYGLWFCTFIVCERLWDDHRKKLKKLGKLKTLKKNRRQKAAGHIVTLLAVMFSTPFFRANSMDTALRYLKRMLVWDASDGILMLHRFNNYTVFILIVALVFVFPVFEKLKKAAARRVSVRPAMNAGLTCLYRLGLAVVFLTVFCYAVSSGYSSFMYEIF